MQHTIALLATGDEIVEGDVINTASPAIAQILKPLGLPITTQMACDDQQQQITQALTYLLEEHSIVIITGGLGPTSDDRTRYSLAEVINEPLMLDEISWDRVYSRIMKHRGFVPENNKQQSLFPPSATIIENTSGTADGCHVIFDHKHLFMLPGPPSQSIPMVEDYIKPYLEQHDISQPFHRASYMLLDASESHLATKIDAALENSTHSIEIGYRFNPPYLQFKLKSPAAKHLHEVISTLDPILQEYIWQEGHLTATEHLAKFIQHNQHTFYFADHITAGRLNTLLINKHTSQRVCFAPNTIQADYEIHMSADQAIFEYLAEPTYRFNYTWHLLVKFNGKVLMDQSFTHAITQQFALQSITEWIAIELLRACKD